MTSKRVMTPENIEECKRAREIFMREKERSGLTYKVLGKMIGTSEQAVSAVMNAHMKISISMGIKLANAFGVDVEEILPWTAEIAKTGGDSDLTIQFEQLNDENREIALRLVRNLLASQ